MQIELKGIRSDVKAEAELVRATSPHLVSARTSQRYLAAPKAGKIELTCYALVFAVATTHHIAIALRFSNGASLQLATRAQDNTVKLVILLARCMLINCPPATSGEAS